MNKDMSTSANSKVDDFLKKAKTWQAEFITLRIIALNCGLTEEFKWGKPCYTLNGHNIVLIHGFKDYCAFLFFKGALLQDTKGVLIQQTENTQAARQIRFTSTEQIAEMEPILTAYIGDAIATEAAGLQVPLKATAEFTVPKEFDDKLNENPVLKTAFNSLTPGRQRGYLLYFSAPKQAKTRASRIANLIPKILAGKGLNDL